MEKKEERERGERKKRNKDEKGEEMHVQASAASASSSKPAPSSKQAKNPFFTSRDYLDHTLETICNKTGICHFYYSLYSQISTKRIKTTKEKC